MKLSRILQAIEPIAVGGPPSEEITVSGLSYDSRQVRPGEIFFCIKGFATDGHLYVGEAVAAGAVAIVHSEPVEVPPGIVTIQVADSRRAMGLAGACFYSDPASRLTVIGVTGTKGKTTTTYLIKAILEAAGSSVGLIGTNQNLIKDRVIDSSRTTPESLDLQRLLADMVKEGCSHAVMEVSSHAVELGRTIGTAFDLGVFTNISRDHLDFHQTFEHYLAAKTRFFQGLGTQGKRACAVINTDAAHSGEIIKKTSVPVLTYGIEGNPGVKARDVVVAPTGVSYQLVTSSGTRSVNMRLTGMFNVYNSLAAAAAALALNLDLDAIVAGLEGVSGVDGRFEVVDLGQDFVVVVDYAHSPDSLENVLQTARALTTGKVIVAFGCGGNRDRGKRPEMGVIAAKLADYVVITSDNPRQEDPLAICQDIEQGVLQVEEPPPYEIVLDRKQGIFRAIDRAQSGDLVLIAGKGHETYQIFGDRSIHFDDREVARAAIANKERDR